jgi:hypothetical protein
MLKPKRHPKTKSMTNTEKAASLLRHELRNKFSSILNAVTYIERSLEKMQLPGRDPRIARFFELIGKELEAADRLLDKRAPAKRGPDAPRVRE